MKLITSLLLLIAVSSCTKVYVPTPSEPSSTYFSNNQGSTGTPINTAKDTIEFRVAGNASSVKVRYNNSIDGLVQVNTTLPYIVDFQTSNTTLFLSLDATPISYPISTFSPFLAVQILVNGNLFREATASDFQLNTLSVSGTYRR